MTNLKYYLRGLGIGILVTAIIMGIVSGRKQGMTDEEVKSRARELGMVESSTLLASIADAQIQTPEPDRVSTPVPERTTPPEETKVPETEETATPEPEETVTPEPEETEAPTPEPTPTPTPTPTPEPTPTPTASGDMVTITIARGENSVTVSRTLANAGLVEDAAEYDKYLCANGYDKTIRVGTYHIPAGSTKEEIAKVITGRISFD